MISLYIHIPFCKHKCAYCSFYSLENFDKSEYIDALIRCVKYCGAKTAQKADTVYIGGGTPSVLPPKLIYRLFEAVRQSFCITGNAEITIEANPESCTDEFLDTALKCGANRLSLGVQSFCDSELCAVGRIHTSDGALSAVKRARAAGFDNISCDLIFGLPGQTPLSFEKSLNTLIGLEIGHVSCYNLQIEEGTPLERLKIAVPDEEQQEKMYFLACGTLESAGFEHYEISNFAKPGYRSRHNSSYWTGKDYLGLGPAAHSKLGDMRFSFLPDIGRFCARTDFEFDTGEKITDPLFERIMLSLRTDRGLELSLLKNSGGLVKRLVGAGYAFTENGVLHLSDSGFYLSNSIISELAAKEC